MIDHVGICVADRETASAFYSLALELLVEGGGKLEGEGTKGLFPGLLTGSPESFAELEKSYEASDLGETSLDNLRVHHLSFQARPGSAVYCQAIELFIDAAVMLPVRQTCREANESEITLTLSDIERNTPLAKNLFEVEIPEGVEKIERRGTE